MDMTVFSKLEAYANLLEALNALKTIAKVNVIAKIAVWLLVRFCRARGDKLNVEASRIADAHAEYHPPEGMTAGEFEECIKQMRHYQEASQL